MEEYKDWVLENTGEKVRIGHRGEECFGNQEGWLIRNDGRNNGRRQATRWKNLVRAGEDKVVRRMILESESNYILPAATEGEWKLMDKRFKPNESGVGWIILRAKKIDLGATMADEMELRGFRSNKRGPIYRKTRGFKPL